MMDEYATHAYPVKPVSKVVVDQDVAGLAVLPLMPRRATDDFCPGEVRRSPFDLLISGDVDARRDAGQERATLADFIDVAEKFASAGHERDRPVEVRDGTDAVPVHIVRCGPARRPCAEMEFVVAVKVGDDAIHINIDHLP